MSQNIVYLDFPPTSRSIYRIDLSMT